MHLRCEMEISVELSCKVIYFYVTSLIGHSIYSLTITFN
jgi:hypothetical protein